MFFKLFPVQYYISIIVIIVVVWLYNVKAMILMWDLNFIFSVVETDGDADYTKAAAELDSAKPRRIVDKQLHSKSRTDASITPPG